MISHTRLGGAMAGPHVPTLTPLRLLCPAGQHYELGVIVDVSVYPGYVQIQWRCNACVNANVARAAIHTAILPAANYVSPEVRT